MPAVLATRACEFCDHAVPEKARFCGACGAALIAPTQCPACAADVPEGAKFCGDCGCKLVGPRAGVPAEAVVSEPVGAPAAPRASALEELQKATNTGGKKSSGSGIGANVMVFVALLALLVVAIYTMNKGAKKEVSPFEGGPAPGSQATAAAQPAQPSAPAAAAGKPEDAIEGEITIAPELVDFAKGKAVFLILRGQGMINRGPPIASRRYLNPSFPLKFKMTAADVMQQGMPFEGPFDLYVRLDQDGNAFSKVPGDLFHEKGVPVKKGQKAVAVVLDRKL